MKDEDKEEGESLVSEVMMGSDECLQGTEVSLDQTKSHTKSSFCICINCTCMYACVHVNAQM